jgi:lycopene elongase/hydratase (dihydrobisanhydrobacterioruberin-forming)
MSFRYVNILVDIVFISRPHIWIYTLGSFLLGVQLAFKGNHQIDLLTLSYFIAILTIPVNFFLYYINDVMDSSTDESNPKKQSLEGTRATNNGFLFQKIFFLSLFIIGIPIFFIIRDTILSLLILIWFLLVLTYNLPPLQLKARPFLDCLFAVNFPLWGVIGYYLVSGNFPALPIFVIVALMAISFHIYSAINDIPYDKNDKIITTAVFFGVSLSILACIILNIFAIALSLLFLPIIISLFLLLYLLFYIIHFFNTFLLENPLYSYKLFLSIHYFAGFIFGVLFVI